MSLSEIIPLVVVFAMYTTLVVCAACLVVWGIGKLLKTMKTMRINKIVGCLKMTYKMLAVWFCKPTITASIQR
jgi:type VI protein secretion system component VasK